MKVRRYLGGNTAVCEAEFDGITIIDPEAWGKFQIYLIGKSSRFQVQSLRYDHTRFETGTKISRYLSGKHGHFSPCARWEWRVDHRDTVIAY